MLDDGPSIGTDTSIAFDDGRGRLWSRTPRSITAIPPSLADRFAPAELAVFEWTDYWIRHDDATWLHVGDDRNHPVDHGLYRLRFENRLGLARIQPYDAGGPLCPPLWIEVLSRKFPTPAAHLSFLSALVDDLFARAANLPFALAAPTARAVVEAPQPPTPLFVLYFLVQYAAQLRAAWNTVQAMPHRRLDEHPAVVPLVEVTEVDADVLLDVLGSPDRWAPARAFPLAERLGGYAPVEVWQRRPIESLDTPENRFVLAFLRDVLAAAERLPAEPWWQRVSPERRHAVREATVVLRLAVAHPMFAEVGPMHRFPAASRVLMRRHGYRQVLDLWRRFHQARRPLFAALQHALDVRDVATLYETWAFFALVDEIGLLLNVTPTVEQSVSDESGLAWQATARFGGDRALVYNRTLRSYSVPLRPDFLWIEGRKPAVALDAKFRLERHDLADESDDGPRATAQRADLYKMHTYRDALEVRTAVAVYPGNEAVFFDFARGKVLGASLSGVLMGEWSGVGALPMRPAMATGGEVWPTEVARA